MCVCLHIHLYFYLYLYREISFKELALKIVGLASPKSAGQADRKGLTFSLSRKAGWRQHFLFPGGKQSFFSLCLQMIAKGSPYLMEDYKFY